jgi:hypothetical protein
MRLANAWSCLLLNHNEGPPSKSSICVSLVTSCMYEAVSKQSCSSEFLWSTCIISQTTEFCENLKFCIMSVWVPYNCGYEDITPCSPFKVNRSVGGTHRRNLQGRRINQARNLLSCLLIARLILRPWRCRLFVPPKHLLTINGLHGVISQETVLFISVCSQ